MILGLAVDGLLIVLLAATLAFALQLNRRLAAIRADQGEFARLAASFAEAAARAEDSVARLKIAAGAGQDEIERADRLADDLRYLLERGTSLADRLESAVTSARDAAPALRRSGKPTLRPAASPAPMPAAAAPTVVPTTGAPGIAAAAGRASARAGDGAGLPRSRAERELLAALRSAGLAE
jgi:Domain of unknown function (DUF6468)